MKPHGIGRVSTLALLVSLALTGCGSDGDDAQPNVGTAQSVEQLNLAVTNVEVVNGETEVTVLATNQDDDIVSGLTELEIRQYQLHPISNGNSAYWQSNDSFADYQNNGDGTYTFVLTDAEQERHLTQRYNVISAAGTLADGISAVPHKEISVDFSGDGGPARYSKNVVAQQACVQCHSPTQPLSQRHGSFYELETCISCHNEDRFGGELASFQHLIHAVHSTHGHGEPVESDDPLYPDYIKHSFSDKYGNLYSGEAASGLIKDNCQVCHQANDELTEWGNWSRIPTKETCSSCHNQGYEPDTKAIIHTSHLAGFSDNESCASCHGADEIERIHDNRTEQANTDAVAELLSAKMNLQAQENGDVTMTLTLHDAAGNAVDANDYQEHIQWVEVAANVGPKGNRLSYYGKATAEYNVSLEANARAEGGNAVVFAEDGTLQTTFSGLLTDGYNGDSANDFADETAHVIAGIRYFANEGELSTLAEHTELVAGKAAAGVAAINGTPEQRHYDSVDGAKCATCHGDNFQVHNSVHHAGFIFNDEFKVGDCAACHTAQGTYAPFTNGALETKVHSTHAKPSFGSNCAACHTSFNVDSFADKQAIAWTTDGSATFATPFAATCSACHNSELARNHMEQAGNAVFGATWDVATQAAVRESCSVCHDAAAIAEHHLVQF